MIRPAHAAAVLIAMIVFSGFTWAWGAIDRGMRAQLDALRAGHDRAIEAAIESFERRVADANERLAEAYDRMATRLEERGDGAGAEAIREELAAIITGAEDRAAAATETGAAREDDRAAGTGAGPADHAAIIQALGERLVDFRGRPTRSSELAAMDYVVLYHSASWCGPCRSFTPDLVAFYNERGGGESFEVILVGSDRSEPQMLAYMQDDRMPWKAVPYGEGHQRVRQSYGSGFIPYLVILDREGKVVSENRGSAQQALSTLARLVQQKRGG